MSDPIQRHLRQCHREVAVVAVLWLVSLIWTLVAMITMGYLPPEQRPEIPELVWGMPAWVAWGLFLPWLLQIAAAWWFALCVLKDDDLPDLLDVPSPPEPLAD